LDFTADVALHFARREAWTGDRCRGAVAQAELDQRERVARGADVARSAGHGEVLYAIGWLESVDRFRRLTGALWERGSTVTLGVSVDVFPTALVLFWRAGSRSL